MAAPNNTLSISLEELVPDGTVRIKDDGLLYAVDFTMLISGKNRDDAAKDLRNIPEDFFPSAKFITRNTGGRGNYKTKLVSLNDAIQLIMILPGKFANQNRCKFASILKRYFAGDSSVVKQLKENAESSNPINVLVRHSIAQEHRAVVEDDDKVLRKRRKVLDYLEIQERMEDIEIKQLKIHLQHIQSLIPKQFSDDEAMIAFRDKGLNIAICKYYKEHHKQNNSTGRRTTRCGLSRCSNEGWPSCRE